MLLGPLFLRASFGPVESGKFDGKMILISSLWDREAMPWQADWYRQRIAANFGASADQHVRLWYTDYAQHGDEYAIEDPTRTVSYAGELQFALRALAAWVEQCTPPPASTSYRIEDGQVIVPPTAALRKGVQPVVTLTVNGGPRADIAAGQTVSFTGTIAAPPGGGTVVDAAWDFDGAGTFPEHSPTPNAHSVTVTIKHRFDKPGTYFPALLGTTQPRDAQGTPYVRMQDLGRVRVVVR
jgi:hypothetical protein